MIRFGSLRTARSFVRGYCVWRVVLRHTFHPIGRRGAGSYRLFLDCGHNPRRKASKGLPSRARCFQCEDLRAGSVTTYTNLDGRTKEVWTWDPVRAMPNVETVPA